MHGMSKSLSSLSFFSGCFGLDLGLEAAGLETKLACEVDKSCLQTIRSNRPDLPLFGDIYDHTCSEIKKAAGLRKNQRPLLITGGPPCQSFSTAGKRGSINDPRGNLLLYFIDLAMQIQPNYLVLENVRGLLSAPLQHRPHAERGVGFPPLTDEELPGGVLKAALQLLEEKNYCVSFNLYNSANYGTPQARERVILIASRDSTRVPFLKPTHSKNGEFGLKPWVVFKDAVQGLVEKKMTGMQFPEKRLKYYKLLKQGEHWRHLPTEKMQREALGNSYHAGGGKTGFLRRVAWNKPCPTVVTNPAMPATDLCHPKKNRPLTVEEYKRVQQFPDEWIIKGTVMQQYRQLGNAVPLGLGRAVGEAIINHMNRKSWDESELLDFKYSRYKHASDKDWEARHASPVETQPVLFK